jgi:hypothetical protein
LGRWIVWGSGVDGSAKGKAMDKGRKSILSTNTITKALIFKNISFFRRHKAVKHYYSMPVSS